MLAIVAYFQPVTRAYIDNIRGVDSSYTVSQLAERGLIEACGRLDVPGRPSLFRTTDLVLRTMGVRSLEELPPLPEDFSLATAPIPLLDDLRNCLQKIDVPVTTM